MDGKGQSLEEVEAGIRNMRQQNRNHHNMNQMTTAFDDFVSMKWTNHFPCVMPKVL